jgi:hypothetical protein
MKTDTGKWVFEPFDLPVFEKPQIEWWPSKMTWDDTMRAFDGERTEYMRTHYSPEDRLRDKNPEPFRMD